MFAAVVSRMAANLFRERWPATNYISSMKKKKPASEAKTWVICIENLANVM